MKLKIVMTRHTHFNILHLFIIITKIQQSDIDLIILQLFRYL